jgi:uncharacterized damage-inducible protein DinB
MDEKQNIAKLIQRTFEKHPWHGPSVREVLGQIRDSQANSRLAGTHSITELVQHMTAWRVFTTKKLNGDLSYKVTEELNFPVPKQWAIALEELERSQSQLLEALQNFPAEKLSELVPHGEHRYTYYTMLHGIVHHDLYHLGQIMLIHKATKSIDH